MQWAQYHQNIIFCYQVAIDAWPKDIPFANLSNVSSSLSQLELLLQKWKLGTIHWKKLSDKEDKELQQKRDREIENGDIEERPCHMHSDKGKKRKRHSSDNNPPSWKKYKSTEIIEDEDEGSGNPHEGPAISTDDNPTSGTSTMYPTDTSKCATEDEGEGSGNPHEGPAVSSNNNPTSSTSATQTTTGTSEHASPATI